MSRDAVLDAAMALMEQEPSMTLSLNGVARALKVTPMAIYTYFSSKDDLLQALTERLLGGLEWSAPASGDPFETLLAWSRAMRTHFLKHPQLIDMLVWEGGHVSVSWVHRGMTVFDALSRLGLEGRELARATLWLWHVVMGAIHIELKNQKTPQTMSEGEFNMLPPSLQAPVSLLMAFSRGEDNAEDFFLYQVERALDALQLMLPDNHKNGGPDNRDR
jgi:AcrR family transcriptional regulator